MVTQTPGPKARADAGDGLDPALGTEPAERKDLSEGDFSQPPELIATSGGLYALTEQVFFDIPEEEEVTWTWAAPGWARMPWNPEARTSAHCRRKAAP